MAVCVCVKYLLIKQPESKYTVPLNLYNSRNSVCIRKVEQCIC